MVKRIFRCTQRNKNGKMCKRKATCGYELIDSWLEMCRAIVAECPCQDGCPSCVGLANLRPPIHHDPDLGSGYPVPDKQATLLLLDMVKAPAAGLSEGGAR